MAHLLHVPDPIRWAAHYLWNLGGGGPTYASYCRRLCVSTKRVCQEHVLLERMRSVFGRGSDTCCVHMWMCLTVVLVSANALAWVLVCANVLASAVLFVQLPLDCGHI
jgi:hypothetical protein